MSILAVVIWILLLGLLAWAVQYVPFIPSAFKKIAVAFLAIVAVLIVLHALGLFRSLNQPVPQVGANRAASDYMLTQSEPADGAEVPEPAPVEGDVTPVTPVAPVAPVEPPAEQTELPPAIEAAAEEVMPSAVVDEVANVAESVAKAKGEDAISMVLKVLGGIMVAVWLSAETIAAGLTRITARWGVEIAKSTVALPMGVAAAGAVWDRGWLPTGSGPGGLFTAMLFGLIAAGLAGGLHRQGKDAIQGLRGTGNGTS